jgi:hypothetical protein
MGNVIGLEIIVLIRDSDPMHVRLKINFCGTVRCEPGWQWDTPPQGFSDYDLWYVWAGQGSLQAGTEVMPVSRGRLFVLPPGEFFRGRHDPEQPLGVCFIHFDYLNRAGRPTRPRQTPPLMIFFGRFGSAGVGPPIA